MFLCSYSTLFGKPHTGIHSYRIFDIAIVDVMATLILAYVLYDQTNDYFQTNYAMFVFILFLISIILHRVFCVRTTVDKMIFM